MKLATSKSLPQEYNRGFIARLLQQIDDQVNNLTDGKVNAVTNSYTAAPAGGTHAVGDFVRNTNTVEVGVAPYNYVILGWICTVAGTPGTFTEVRADASGAISVGGPGSSTDNAVARWNGTGGNSIQNSVVLIGDTGAVTGVTTLGMSGQLTSTLVTGTAPLVVASTTKVTNLNADLLDDQSGSYYLDSANFTGTNWTDLTDTGATTLHKHDHGGQDGLADDDHTQYLLASAATNRVTFAANWTDLTDGGATTLHTHSYQPLDTQLTSLAGLSYTGNSLKVVRVNAGETDFELATVSGTGDVTAALSLTDNAIVRGDGGAKGVQTSSVLISDTNDVTGMASLTLTNTGLHLLDTNASHDLIIAPGSDLSADRTLTITTGDADRTLTLSASTTLNGGTHSGTNTGDQTDITGNAGTVTVANEATDTTCFPLFATAASGSLGPKTNANMTFNSNTGVVTFASSVLTTTDINGGTIDGVTLVVSANTITTAASGNLAATELNAALAELQSDIDTRAKYADIHAFAAAYG